MPRGRIRLETGHASCLPSAMELPHPATWTSAARAKPAFLALQVYLCTASELSSTPNLPTTIPDIMSGIPEKYNPEGGQRQISIRPHVMKAPTTTAVHLWVRTATTSAKALAKHVLHGEQRHGESAAL